MDNKQQFNQQHYQQNGMPPTQSQVSQKQSGLGIAALIMCITGCLGIIGLILAIIDLCQKDQTKKHTCSKVAIVIFIVYLFIIAIINFGNYGENTTSSDSSQATVLTDTNETNIENSKEEVVAEEVVAEEVTEPEIEYETVSVQELEDELKANALRASEDYKGKYVELTGLFSNIDASGQYIGLKASSDDYTFINIQCYIKNDDQKTRAMEFNTGEEVTLKGKITDVGEIMGYSIDIVEFE